MRLQKGRSTLFIDEHGATVTRHQKGEVNILFPQQKVIIGNELELRGGSHPMFPWFGPPPKHEKKQHGFLRDMDFESKAYSNSGEMTYTHRGHGMYYPWSFYATANFRLYDAGFFQGMTIDLRHSHCQESKMPINFGFHPYFFVGNSPMISYTIRGRSYPVIMETLAGSKETKFYKLKRSQDEHVLLDIPQVGTIRISCQGFSYIALWTDDPRYLCLEPICTLPRDFNTPNGSFIKIGESETYGMSIKTYV